MGKAKAERRLADNEARSKLRLLRTSPQKLNLVAQSIRGKTAEKALAVCPPAAAAADGDVPLKAYQLDMLSQLRKLRAKMAAEDNGAVSGAEVEALKAENAKMAAENKALNYRIAHLLRSLDAAEKA